MAAPRQIGIEIKLDTTSVSTGSAQVSRDLDRMGTTAQQASLTASKGLGQLTVSLGDVARGGLALSAVAAGIQSIGAALTALPKSAFDYSKNLETTQVGMAGILGSMTAVNGQQLQYNAALSISSQMIRKLNDDALRTAASSQELTSTFQALLAPGLAARMTLEQIRELTVVGTNAVKSMGLSGAQVVQELRDLVSGGITAAGSQLASALGLKDEDIAKARASSEGLFSFLMDRLKGFKESADYFGNTLQGRMDTLQEGAVRVVSAGMEPLTQAIKTAAGEAAALFGVFEEGKDAQLNPLLVEAITEFSEKAVAAIDVSKRIIAVAWEHRDAIAAVWTAYKVFKFAEWATEATAVVQAKLALSQASRLAAMEAVVEASTNTTVVATSREKAAAYLAELQAKASSTQATAAATEAELLSLNAERNAIALKQASATAAFEQARASMAASEAHLVAARSAGALSFALAAAREASDALNAAQARRAALGNELAALTARQAQVEASVATATAAHTAASNAAAVASTQLAAATGAASIAGRAFSTVVGALGGPVGIAILAVSSLAMWLWKAKSASDEASDAMFRLNRAKAALDAGGAVKERDVVVIQSELQKAQAQLDELEKRAGNIAPNTTAQARFKAQLDAATAKVQEYEGLLEKSRTATSGAAQGTSGLTVTLAGAEQAWRKANDGVKTGSAAQEEYRQKLSASRTAYEAYKQALVNSGADRSKIDEAAKRQAENEKALADDRDKKIKEMGSASASAQAKAIDAQVAAVQHGYKLLAQQTADGLDEIDSLRKQDVISEYSFVQRKRDLALQDLAGKEESLRAELALLKGKKDSAKEQANLEGQLTELQQQRTNLQNKAARDLQELLVKPQNELLQSTRQATQSIYDQAAALEAQNSVFGQGAAAITGLNIAQLEKTKADLEATENVIPGYIDQINRQIAALKRLQTAQYDAAGLDAGKKATEEAARASERIAEQAIKQNEQIAQSLTDNLMRGGKSAADYLKDLFRTLVLRPVLSFIVNPITGAISGLINQVLGLGGSSSGSGISGLSGAGSLLNGTGLLGSAGTALGTAGTSALATAQGWLGMTGTAAQASTAAANGVAYAATGSGSMAATIGSYAPYVAAALLAYNVLSSMDGGETRTGGQYSVAYGGELKNNRRGESYQYVGQQYNRDNSLNADGTRTAVTNGQAYLIEADGMGKQEKAVKDAVAATATSINDTLKALGSKATTTGYWAGLETSGNGRGGVFSGGSLSNGKTFGESGKGDNYSGTLYEKWSTNSPNSEEAMANFTLDLKQSYLQALQADMDEIPKVVGNMLKDQNVEELSSDAVDTLIAAIGSQITAVKQFGQVVDSMPFEDLKGLSFDAAAGLVELSGGIDKLSSNLSSYLQNYYSETERQDQVRKNITASLADVGLSLPATREAFKALVEAQDKETESGRKAWIALMAVQDAFASVTPSAEEAAKAVADQAAAEKAAAEEKAKAAADAAAALKAANKSATDAAYQALQNSVSAQKTALQATEQTVQATISKLKSLFDTLGSAVSELYAENASTAAQSAAQGKQFIADAVAAAQNGGALPDQEALTAAIAAVRASITRGNYATPEDMERDRMVLAAQLNALKGVTGTQLTTAEEQLQATQTEIARLDTLLDTQKAALDALRGNVTATLSVSEAVAKLAAAVLKESADATAVATKPATTSESTSGASSQFVVGGGGSGSGSSGSSSSGTSGSSGSTGASSLFVVGGSPVKSFAVGTDYVSNDMLAQIHQGERIVPAAYNRSDATNAELLGVLQIIAALLERSSGSVSKVADILSSVQRGPFIMTKNVA